MQLKAMLNKSSQTEKDEYHIFPHLWITEFFRNKLAIYM